MPRTRRSRTTKRRRSSPYSCAGKSALDCTIDPLCNYETSLVSGSPGRSPYFRNQCKSVFTPPSLYSASAGVYASAMQPYVPLAQQQMQLNKTASINALNTLISQSSNHQAQAIVEQGLADAARAAAEKVAQMGMPKKSHKTTYAQSPSVQLQHKVPSQLPQQRFDAAIAAALAKHVGQSAGALQRVSNQASAEATKASALLTPSLQLQGLGDDNYALAMQLALLQGTSRKKKDKFTKELEKQMLLQQLGYSPFLF
jgi:hypothetical protein